MLNKNTKKLISENRLIYQNLGRPGSVETADKPETHIEKWREVNARTQFKQPEINTPESIEKAIDDQFLELAESAFPGDKDQQKEYAKRIHDSLKNHLAPEKTLSELWGHLTNQQCEIVAIIEGLLNFFKGDETKIDVNSFFNVASFEAKLPEDAEYEQNRQTEINNTIASLGSLLNDLRAANPNLPPPPTRLS